MLTDVVNSYENLQTNDEIIKLYRSGYLDAAQESRDISEYAYKRGAASLLDFLDAERSYRAVRSSLIGSLWLLTRRRSSSSRSGGNKELAMKTEGAFSRLNGARLDSALIWLWRWPDADRGIRPAR